MAKKLKHSVSPDDPLRSVRDLIDDWGLGDALRTFAQEESESDENAIENLADDPPSFPKSPTDFDPARAKLAEIARQPKAMWRRHRRADPLRKLNPRIYGGGQYHWKFEKTMAAGVTRRHLSKQDADCWNDGDKVFIECTREKIPHGLCWLLIPESDGAVTLHLPSLEWNGKLWLFRGNLKTILGVVRDKKLEPIIVPLNEFTVDCFNSEEVRRFLNDLPLESEQRVLATRLLDKKA